MSQPPSFPHGVDVPWADGPGTWGASAGPDDPTRQFGPPGQREPTQRLDQPAAYGPPGQFGPPPYGQAQYGPPPYGPAWAPPGPLPRKNRSLTIALVIAAVVLLAAGGVALWLLIGRGDDSPSSGSLPPATETPDDLGLDPVLDGYAVDCYEGAMDACDALFIESEAGSRYETYGDTCAGRQPPGTNVFCTVSFPAE